MYNIRFIALTDNVDTANSASAGMDMMPIMNVVSVLYGQNPKATYLPIKIPPQDFSCGGFLICPLNIPDSAEFTLEKYSILGYI